ncbi:MULTISPECIES: HEPN domain-containing protein [unclassified Crossiella]|uniref:HEPN domain-containing protein n=1 Tax=unclassified Crossiella TaxID=2620835 RepID=UPI00200044D1|nr:MULTISPECIES: HEPN domain-containing protein [unclassified Crossiella]MCK2240887.1 HEPN domain-containing protein [Crossiella sp. S99.2]MCK2253969.1 HEPN domain-containing protein [Crossiella sp. S99.1]
MSAFEVIQKVYEEQADLASYLREKNEISFLSALESYFPKVTLLGAASDLEARTVELIVSYFSTCTNSNKLAVNFVKNKAVNRQYHTYFDWDKKLAANKFFSLFGPECKRHVQNRCKSDETLRLSIDSFCEIGALRNQLVHNNYATFSVNLTTEEIFSKYQSALHFLEVFPGILDEILAIPEELFVDSSAEQL